MLESVSPAIWDNFVEESPQGTIFSTTKWLDLFGDYELLGYYKNGNLAGGMVLQKQMPLTPFQGVLVRAQDGKYATRMSLENEVVTALIPAMGKRVFCNHYALTDIRPFLWAGFTAGVKYTYVWTPSCEMEKDTRYIINRYNAQIGQDFDKLDWLYTLTFQRKGMERPVSSKFLRRMCEATNAEVLTCDGAGVILIKDSKRYYYIIGASDGEGASSYLLWNAIKDKHEVDFVGCNDRKIGLFKRGFGGRLMPYYQVSNV